MADPILPAEISALVRIRKGEQRRSVWTVHLPGWLAQGWSPVAGAVEPSIPAAAAPATPGPVAPAEEEPGPRRGRRKATAAQKPEEPIKPEATPSETESKAQTASDQPPGAESKAESQPEPDSALAAVAGLPEDLFDDSLA
jgi:hypothetical protein